VDTIHRTQIVCAVLEETDVEYKKKICCARDYIGVVFAYLCHAGIYYLYVVYR